MIDKKNIEKLLPSPEDIKDYRLDLDEKDSFEHHPIPKEKILPIIEEEDSTETYSTEKEIDSDFIQSRKKIRKAAEVAAEVVVELKEIAEQSGHPRVYEVLNQSIKNLASVSRDLVELYKIKNEGLAGKDEPEKTVTNNNLVFAGSTAELAKILQNLKKQ